MRDHRKFRRVIPVMAAFLLIFAACTGDDEPTDDAGVEDTATPDDTDVGDADEAQGEIIIAVPNEPPDLMPGSVGHNEVNTPGMRNVFETLVDRHPETQELVPALATSWELIDDDRWRFTLREGVTFHDGSEFNASVAGEALEFITNPDLSADERGFIADVYSGPPFTAEVVDDYTLDIVTEAPDPVFPTRSYFFHIYSTEAAEEDPSTLVESPVGTGPYRFVDWSRGQSITIESNPDWWGHDDPDALGDVYFDRAQFVFRGESSVRAAMVEAGEAHLAMGIDPDQCSQVEEVSGAQCLTEGAPDIVVIRFDALNDESMFTDRRVREAWTLAVDIHTLADEVMDGGMIPGGQAVGPTVAGYDDSLEPRPYDVDRAQELLEEYQADGGQMHTVELVFQEGRFARVNLFAEAMGAMAEDAGFEVEIIQQESGAFTEQWYRGNQPPNRVQIHTHGNRLGDFGPTVTSWFVGNPIGEPGCWCDDPEMFEMIEEAFLLAGDERAEAFRQVNRHVYDEIYMDYGGAVAFHYGASADLNWQPPPDHLFRLEQMSIN